MRQGTISIICGCHSPIHSLLVLISWRRLYGSWPSWWEIICIAIHDIGHIGRNYLDDPAEKARHWCLGADVAGWLFGQKGYDLVAGHCSESGHPRSRLYRADKYSWYIAPWWWIWSNTIPEPKLRMGYSRSEAVTHFKARVRASIESGEFRPTHQFYLERCQDRKERGDGS